MEKDRHVHIEEAAYDEVEIHKAVAAGMHVERKLLDGDDIVLIPTPSSEPKGEHVIQSVGSR